VYFAEVLKPHKCIQPTYSNDKWLSWRTRLQANTHINSHVSELAVAPETATLHPQSADSFAPQSRCTVAEGTAVSLQAKGNHTGK